MPVLRAKVVVLFGSPNDADRVRPALALLQEFGVPFAAVIVSAHRDPERLADLVRHYEEEGVGVFICAAGLAAHLAGVTAALTVRPVIGVPLSGGALAGQDALYSTVQMPRGIPVATVGIDRADNAALLAVGILALQDEQLALRLRQYRQAERQKLREADEQFRRRLAEEDGR